MLLLYPAPKKWRLCTDIIIRNVNIVTIARVRFWVAKARMCGVSTYSITCVSVLAYDAIYCWSVLMLVLYGKDLLFLLLWVRWVVVVNWWCGVWGRTSWGGWLNWSRVQYPDICLLSLPIRASSPIVTLLCICKAGELVMYKAGIWKCKQFIEVGVLPELLSKWYTRTSISLNSAAGVEPTDNDECRDVIVLLQNLVK